MPKLKEDVSSNPNAFILGFMKTMLTSQLLISSSDTLRRIQDFLGAPQICAEYSLSLYRMQILIGLQSTGKFFVLKIHNSYLFPFSGFCTGAGCQGLTCSRWIHGMAVWLGGALFCGQTSTQEGRKQWGESRIFQAKCPSFGKGHSFLFICKHFLTLQADRFLLKPTSVNLSVYFSLVLR